MNDRANQRRSYFEDWGVQLLTAVLSVVASLLVGALFILGLDANPLVAYQAIIEGAFGNLNAITETLVKATPLLLAGIGLAIAYKANFWNIGAEGQIFIGGLLGAWFALTLGSGLPAILLIPLEFICGFIGGALWAIIPTYLKVRRGIDEIITTIMFNYIAALLTNWVIHGPLRDPSAGFPRTSIIPDAAQLPILIPRTRLHIGVLVAVLIAVIAHYILKHTSLGFHIRAVGDNREATAYGGIPLGRTLFVAMILSGGLAGLAGTVQVAGLHYRVIEDISDGIGFTAIAVSLLANNQPLGLMISSFVLAALDVGANAMQYKAQVPASVVDLIQGLVILFVVGREFATRRLVARRRAHAEKAEHVNKMVESENLGVNG